MEVVFQLWHVAVEKAAVLADAVAAHGGGVFVDVLLQKFDGQVFGFSGVDVAVFDSLREAGLTVLAGAPFVHGVEHVVWLVNGDGGAFGDGVELRVGDEGGDFDNYVVIGIEACHFQVNPNKIVFAVGHDSWPLYISMLLIINHTIALDEFS